MRLNLSSNIAEKYNSGSQAAIVMTENWVSENMYCPRYGNIHLKHFENNRPVADPFCSECNSEYELKSKNGAFGRKIRQQLQLLRDNGFIEFLGNGQYRKYYEVIIAGA